MLYARNTLKWFKSSLNPREPSLSVLLWNYFNTTFLKRNILILNAAIFTISSAFYWVTALHVVHKYNIKIFLLLIFFQEKEKIDICLDIN